MVPIRPGPTGQGATPSQGRSVCEPAVARADRGAPPLDRPWWSEWAAEQREPVAPDPLHAAFDEPASDSNHSSLVTSLELAGELI